jgi:hypothetical protein
MASNAALQGILGSRLTSRPSLSWAEIQEPPEGRLSKQIDLRYSATVVVDRGRVIIRIAETIPQPRSE